jgi:hypothetical protein
MRQVTYTLVPDSGAAVGTGWTPKTAPLDEFLLDAQDILYHQNIPPLDILNQMLNRGYAIRTAEWEPFEIDEEEYEEVVAALVQDEARQLRRYSPPSDCSTPEQWQEWLASIGY